MTDSAAPAPPATARSTAWSGWLMALALFAFSLWLYSRHNDFPFSYHPDEGGKTGQVIGGIRNYHHPLLLLSVTDIVSRLSFTSRDPQTVVEVGRWVSAAFAAGAVVALALLARLRYGTLAGWITGLAVALQVDLFETAHYLKEDPTLLFGLALSLFAAQWWWTAPGRRTLRFLGIACGLAAAGKYLGIVALIFALPLVIWPRAGGTKDGELSRGQRLKLFALAFLATFLIGNLPLFATKLSSPFRSVGQEMKGVAGGHRGITREVPHGAYIEMLRENAPHPALFLAAGYTLVVLATARRRSGPEWASLLFPLGYLAIISCSPKIADRYLLPVNVLLPFLGALGAAEAGRLIGGSTPGARQWVGMAALAGLGAWLIHAEDRPLRESFAGFQHDDPKEVAEYIKAHLDPKAIIAEDHRVNLVPTKGDSAGLSKNALVPQKVLDANFVADLGTLDELRARGVTHVAICRQSYGRYFKDETKPREGEKTGYDKRKEFYARVLEEGELIKHWPTGKISYLQPGIKLFRVVPHEQP